MNCLMKYCLLILLTIGLTANFSFEAKANSVERRRTILTPAFKGGELGIRAANVMALQISRTFQEGKNKQFGRGVLLWELKPLQEMNYLEVRRRSLHIGTLAHMVLWGKAYYVEKDVVVQAYLTLTPVLYEITENRPEIWTVKYKPKSDSTELTLTSDLPSQHYTFSPVVLSEDAVRRYQSIPALDIFADRNFSKPIGKIGNGFRAHQYVDDAVKLSSGDVTGWVPLPSLGENETEVTIFTSSLFRILRGDWRGASNLLDNMFKLKNLPHTIYIDALLLRGLVEEKQSKSGLEWFRRAYSLNPLRSGSCQYLIQSLIELGGRKDYSFSLNELKKTLNQCRPLFDQEDNWIKNVDSIVSFLEK